MSRAGAMPALVVSELLVSALLTGCAGLALHRVFAVGALLPVLAVAGFGSALLVALVSTGSRRLSLWLAAPLSVVVWLLLAGATVLRSDAVLVVLPSAATLGDIGAGLRDSWLQLLATILPAPAQPRLLVAVSALVWVAGYAAAELTARTRTAIGPMVPPLLLLLAGLLLGVSGPGSNLAVAVGFLALALFFALMRQPERGQRRAVLRRYLAGLPMLGAVALVAALLGPRLPVLDQRKPFDLRHYVMPAGQPRTTVNPLDQVSAWLATPGLPLFSARSPSAVDWRIASLDVFDGQTWTTSGRFVSTGQRVPAPESGPARTIRMTTEVTVGGLTGLWLPAAESPSAVTGTAVDVDPSTGVLLSQTGLRPDLRYEVTSRVPEFDAATLRFAVPAEDPAARAALTLPSGLPQSIVDTAQQATAGATFPAQQATRLETYLRGTETNDPTAPPGHTYGHLAYFLTVAHRGTTEQFATAFAVMARSLGLPTRIVVGFATGLPAPDGSYTVRGSDALVWPEVDFRGIGWVPFYPTPVAGSASAGAQATPAGATSARQEIDDSLASAPVTRPVLPSTAPHVSHGSGRHGGSGLSWWPYLLILPAGLAVGYLAAVLLVPYLRTRRRRAAGRVAGAWTELVYRLGPLRLGDLSARTTGEVAVAAANRLGGDTGGHLNHLAALADFATFSEFAALPESGALSESGTLAESGTLPEFATPSGGPGPAHYGAIAWQQVDAVRPAIPRAVGRLAMLRYRLRPAVLRS
ncbi:DUF3488 and transglutaminase-like domain-containing protein [Rugosimonospora africana]|uniref:Transglutaminase-like domain-containing protein n=1 Tax=Rugosimonospora africana TaxID=556532 RepID=A0A8J3QYI1_9ACTN|nr:DUF3488 and transglutaminase-like domain-containing protein [Rugosimonospora africana]GIH18856.1 hypothetical protein Raf01_70280 [Rugosimonospora africana]